MDRADGNSNLLRKKTLREREFKKKGCAI